MIGMTNPTKRGPGDPIWDPDPGEYNLVALAPGDSVVHVYRGADDQGQYLTACCGEPVTPAACIQNASTNRCDTDDTRREDEPGDWFVSGFSGVCSRCGREFGKDVTIRADGDGGHECRVCVAEDQRKDADQDAYEAELLSGRPFGEDWTHEDREQAATFWTMPVELWGEFA